MGVWVDQNNTGLPRPLTVEEAYRLNRHTHTSKLTQYSYSLRLSGGFALFSVMSAKTKIRAGPDDPPKLTLNLHGNSVK